MKKIIYATTNPGKFSEVQKIFSHHDLELLSLEDFGVKIDVEETGDTLAENAKLKAESYLKFLPKDSIVIGDDTGVEIDALGGEPGIKVRRWKGHKMTDEDIIDYCLERLKDVPPGNRQAQFHTVLAITSASRPIRYFEGILRGEILLKPKPERREGMPFWPIFYLPDLQMTLGEFHSMPIDFQIKNPTHRELAVLSALPYLRTLTRQP